jgi:hypothetical protein
MEQLTAQDASFLYIETPTTPSVGAWLNIYDPSSAPDGIVRFKQILAAYEARLPLARYLRSRIVRVPMDLDHPYWVDDNEFDLEFHVRHLALPKPGDWRQLCIQVARIVVRPLDLSRPPWELYVIEGLDNVEGVRRDRSRSSTRLTMQRWTGRRAPNSTTRCTVPTQRYKRDTQIRATLDRRFRVRVICRSGASGECQ